MINRRFFFAATLMPALMACASDQTSVEIDKETALQLAAKEAMKFCSDEASCADAQMIDAARVNKKWLVEYRIGAHNYGFIISDDRKVEITREGF